MSNAARIAEIEAEMARTQKNKATAGHLGLLKARIAKLKREDMEGSSSSGGAKGEGFDVQKSGDARVGLVGYPSVGKSTLLTSLTGVESRAADFEFTTLDCIPGQFRYRGCNVQLLDLPGIIEGAKDGKGRGKQVIGVARTCDLILIVLDATKPCKDKKVIEDELEGFGIRLNKRPPDIQVRKTEKGGIRVSTTVPLTHLDMAGIRSICAEFRLGSAAIMFRCDPTPEQLIDVIVGNRVYIPCLYVLNKIDAISIEELDEFDRIPKVVPIAAREEWNFDDLLDTIWQELGLLRIYTKPKGEIPNYEEPVVLPKSKRTIRDFCGRIHKSFVENFQGAKIWGASAKHNAQLVGLDHVLEDEDIVQIVRA